MNVISPENKRILLIDEDAALRERSQGILTRAGYPVTTASNLVEALAHVVGSGTLPPTERVRLRSESLRLPGGTAISTVSLRHLVHNAG